LLFIVKLRNQLLSLSKQTDNTSIRNELSQVDNKLQTMNQELTTIKHIHPSIANHHQQQQITSKLPKIHRFDTLTIFQVIHQLITLGNRKVILVIVKKHSKHSKNKKRKNNLNRRVARVNV